MIVTTDIVTWFRYLAEPSDNISDYLEVNMAPVPISSGINDGKVPWNIMLRCAPFSESREVHHHHHHQVVAVLPHSLLIWLTAPPVHIRS